MKLGEISHIESGLILSRKRARNEFEQTSTYRVLSLTNIDSVGDFTETEMETFLSIDELDDHYFTKKGDIILRLNEPFTAVCIDVEHVGVLVPSYFVIIRLNHNKYLPAYVCWYLNTNEVKKYFLRSQSGTLTPNINQNVLRELSIPRIPIEEQRKIAELNRLYLKERHLLKQLLKEKDCYFRGITTKLIDKLGEK